MSKKEDSFEANLKKLEEIVKKLESGELELDKAIAMFEEGSSIAKACEKRLTSAEEKIEQLIKNRDGEPSATPLDIDE